MSELADILNAIDDIEVGRGFSVPDRALVRAALIEGGINSSELDWMTASCPSLRTARRYFPRRIP